MLIDLNADLGEGAGTDADLMPLITSANVSCGFHAGDPDTIRVALILARNYCVTVGAHPGYYDRENYGRKELAASVWNHMATNVSCLFQIGALITFAKSFQVGVKYVKPHGALYNQACLDAGNFGTAILSVCNEFQLPLVGLQGSGLEWLVCQSKYVPFIPEGFADRRYRPDGSLVPRTEPDALLHDPKEAVEQVEWLIGAKKVRTVCVHGDTPGAVEFVRAVRGFLLDRGHELKAFA